MIKKKLAIRDIITLVKWKEVKRAIKYHYPSDKSNYEKLFYRLQKTPRVRTKRGESLEVYGGIDINSEWYLGKWGKKFLDDLAKGDEELYYSIHMVKEGDEQNWSISFIKWDYLANVPIHPLTLKYFTFEDIVAHFIWEITFYGPEKRMEKKGKEILNAVKEIKAGTAKTEPYVPLSKGL